MSSIDDVQEFSIFLKQSKYHSRCRLCGANIRVGEPCFWRKTEEGGVACSVCVTGESPADRVIPPGPQGEWYKLIRFLRDSVLVGSASELMTPEAIAGCQVSSFTQALGENANQVAISGFGADRARQRLKRRDDGPMSLGWPVLSFVNNTGERKCAPIFVATITVELTEGDEVVLTRESSFALNPALMASDGIGQAIADRIEILGDDISESVANEIIEQVSKDFDIPLEGFDFEETEMGENVSDGIFNTATLVAGDSGATTNLLRELEELMDRTDWAATAAGSLVTGAAKQMAAGNIAIPPIAPLPVNYSQEQILAKSANSNVTVVTGPPGTGKSQVVVDLVANSWVQNQTILVTSTNNAAVDVATNRANDIAAGLLLRTGNKSAREALPDIVTQLVASKQPVDMSTTSLVEANLIRAHKDRAEFYEALRKVAEFENLQNEGVQTEERLLGAVHEFGSLSVADDEVAPLLLATQKIAKARFLQGFRWRRLAKRAGLIALITSMKPTIEWLSIRSRNLDRINQIAKLSEIVRDPVQRAGEVDRDWQDACRRLSEMKVSSSITSNRAKLSPLGMAQSSYYGTLKAIEPTLPYLRGWACTTLSLKQNFPMTAGLFDYVIVDEASQCHLAYILPAAYRAKRLILVGDPNQLPPIAQLTPEQETAIAFRNAISPADLTRRRLSETIYSAFDFFANVLGDENVDLLNEHYRSHPHIARWFNETFYGSQLEILTDIAGITQGSRSLSWLDVPGQAHQPPKGSWVNQAEANRAISLIEEFLSMGKTVGVVTPFSAQAALIERLATKQFGRDVLASTSFRSGTAHAFQGDERDVMIFSCVLAEGISPRVAKWVQTERRLINVAVSRARETLVVLGDPNIDHFDCPTLSSLRMFAQSVYESPKNRVGPRMDSQAERRFYEAMLERGLNPISKFNVEGYELDFGIIDGGIRLNLEVDGDQHYEQLLGQHLRLRRQDIARDGVLTRAGWHVLRIPAWQCFTDSSSVVSDVQNVIASLRQG